jgi:hypothetical protein
MRSNIELLSNEEYKNYYYKRFESTSNIELIKSELLQLLEKAQFLLKFYNENLTIENNLVNKAIEKLKKYSKENRTFHTGIILIENVEPQDIFFGYDGGSYNIDLEWTKRKYNYASNNNELARFCAKLIDFIEGFNFTPTKNENKKSTEKTLSYFKIAVFPSAKKAEQLADALILKNNIDKNSRKDFINAFTGFPPKDKIIWQGHFGDLKTFINHCIKEKYIEKVSRKWIITSTIFSDKEIAFSKDSIRSTKETISKENIKKISHLAKEWHKSEEGRKWHREHAQSSLHKNTYEKICECGKKFKTTIFNAKYCSGRCRNKFYARIWRKKHQRCI